MINGDFKMGTSDNDIFDCEVLVITSDWLLRCKQKPLGLWDTNYAKCCPRHAQIMAVLDTLELNRLDCSNQGEGLWQEAKWLLIQS